MTKIAEVPALIADEEKHLKKIDFFGLSADKIEEYKKDYTGLTIAGIEDKDGYKAVGDGLKILVATRNKLDKHRLAINRYVNDEAKRIQLELNPMEEHLKKQKDTIDTLVAQEEAKKEREAMEKFNKRTGALLEAGYKFDALVYQMGTSILTPEMVKAMNDDVFEKIMNAAKAQAGDVAKAKAAQEKITKDLQAERDQLAKQKADLALQEEMLNKKAELMQKVASGEYASFEVWIDNGKVMHSAKYAVAKEIKANTVSSKGSSITNPDKITPTNEEEKAERQIYNDGFKYCQDLVISILNSPDKITRQILIDKITALKP